MILLKSLRFCSLFILLPALLVAQVADIPWQDAKHKVFFRYQAYLLRQGLQAETERTWAAPKRTAQQRLQIVQSTEAILKRILEETVAQPKLLWDPSRKNLIRTVWGEEVLRGIERVAAALLTR
ncbi:MAG: hypothetical protein HY551_01105, partial [Elusimicrobia bacterium]|nr:hypothetical protein [Elusimicrobiota bacterium]